MERQSNTESSEKTRESERERGRDVPLMIRFMILCLVGVGGIS